MAMRIDILTLFPEMIAPALATSILGRAAAAGAVEFALTNIRDFAQNSYRKVDDAPFGGGAGMVMMCQPVFDAVEAVRPMHPEPGLVVLMTPQGRRLDQKLVEELAGQKRLILVAGHYEGFDERIRTGLVDMEISVGDYVLSGGEVAALVVVDAVTRLLPGAVGAPESTREESFSMGLLEYPHYTRPREFREMTVPDVLLSGDHAKIERWRLEQARERTRRRRPDLWQEYEKKKAGSSGGGDRESPPVGEEP
jgi:tRNA (guanine37-N1)-methyltransferase